MLADGAVPRVTVGTDYALSTLSSTFPKTLANNIAFLFTNVLSPFHWNFSRDALPDVLRDAPLFFFNNPIALQREYLKLKDDPTMERRRADLRNAVKASEQNAIQMLVLLFDWLDGLEPQPTTAMDPNVAKEAKHPPVSSSTCSYLASRSNLILAVNQEPPSDHTDKATLLQRIGKFLTRTVEKSRKTWKRRWGP